MINGDRVRFTTTGLAGTVIDTAERLGPFDGDLAPWLHVQFDDGLICWVSTSSVTTA